MIDGVTLLNETTNLTDGGYAILAIFIIIVMIGIVCGFVFLDEYNDVAAIVSFVISAATIISIIFSSYFLPTEQRYEVLIDDNISKVEFDKHYKVIDQRGDIYTITIKEEDN